MPGTIHVSVLGFKGLSISSIKIKASMGKKEFQIWEKGDFAFPLTTLRDNLIITLQDAEGNEISHAGVRTMSIVEKVVWDDLFPLEGGGHIRMNLQFVLSDEERNRIRMMRETALKKKQKEILNSTPIDAETATNSSSSLPTNEVSDSRMSSVTPNVLTKADHLSKPNIVSKNGESHNASKEKTLQSHAIPNDANIKEEAASSSPVSEGDGVFQKPSVDKMENKLPHPTIQVGPTQSEEASSSIGSSESVVTDKKSVNSRLGIVQDEKPEKQSPIDKIDANEKSEGTEIPITKMSQTPADISTRLKESSKDMKFPKSEDAEKIKSGFLPEVSDENKRLQKTPSNIRKMISAFESSLAQEPGPVNKSMAVESQSNRVGMVRLLKDQVFKGATEITESSSGRLENPVIASLGRLKNSFSVGDLQRIPANILKKGEPISFRKDFGGFTSFQAVKQFKRSSGTKFQLKGTDMGFLKDDLGQAQIDIISKKLEKSDMDEATFSGRKDKERNPAEKLVMSELKSALREKYEKGTEKYKLPSPLEEATVSGRTLKEKDSGGISIEKNEIGSNEEVNTKELAITDSIMSSETRSVHNVINTNELATSESMRPTSLESAKVLEKVHDVGERNSGGISSVKQEIGSSRKETNKMETEISPKDFTRPSNLEAVALQRTMVAEQDSSGKLVVDGKGKRISLTKTPNEINIRGVTKDDLEYFPIKNSGTWIFPDDQRYLCITAEGDNKVTNSSGGVVEGNSDRRNKICDEPENIGTDLVQCGTDAELKNTEDESNASRNSEQERSVDDASTGPLGQIIKIAVVLGFGLFVLLTRQRQPRKEKKKDNDPPFGIEKFIDQKIAIEEHLKKMEIF